MVQLKAYADDKKKPALEKCILATSAGLTKLAMTHKATLGPSLEQVYSYYTQLLISSVDSPVLLVQATVRFIPLIAAQSVLGVRDCSNLFWLSSSSRSATDSPIIEPVGVPAHVGVGRDV